MDPPWKIPSRPCPFFARGNCIFSKSCSFVHEISSRPSPVRSESFDDSYEEHQLERSPVLRSRFSVDFDSSSDGEDSGLDDTNSDDYRNYVDNISQQAFSQNPNHISGPSTSPSWHHTRGSSISSLDKRDSQIRDSVMTIKVLSQNSSPANQVALGHDIHNLPQAEKQTETYRYSRPPRLTLSIPHQFGSIHASHKLVLQDLKKTLRREYGSPTSPADKDIQMVAAAPVQRTTIRSRSSTIRPQNQRPDQKVDENSVLDKINHPPMPITMPTLTNSRPLVQNAPAQPQTGYPISVQESKDGVSENTAGVVVSASEPKSTTPQTPSWFKPLKLTAVLNPQQDTIGPQGRHEQHESYIEPISRSELVSHGRDSPRSQSLSPTSLLTLYSLDPDSVVEHATQHDVIIPINSPRTIVLSDTEDNSISVPPSRASTLDIDMTSFPSARSEYDDDGMSSVGSVTLSVLMGSSPGPSRGHGLSPSFESAVDLHKEKPTSPRAGGFRSKLERRAQRIKESVSILSLRGSELDFSEVVGATGSLDRTHESNRPVGAVGEMPAVNNSLEVENVVRSPRSGKSLDLSPKEEPRPNSAITRPPTRTSSTRSPDPSYRPQLLFAIASDKPETVEDLLATGKSTVNEMADSGMDLLEFTVSNKNLKHKTEIVKTLLKYGADPAVLNQQESEPPNDRDLKQGKDSPVVTVNRHMNAAMEYFLTRRTLDSDSKPTLQALEQSSFAPLAKARFDIIGQDRVLDEFYRVIGVHSQRKTRNALVILLCGASGHGKSFLAQKVGSLLNVPIHTINMTSLRSQHDLWQCLSTGAEDASPNNDLGEFLVECQGRRCVVVLDEIEKVDDPKALNPLLLPWDIGRCSLEQKKHTDTSQVIWIATSNLGQKIIAEHVQQWKHPDIPPSRNEYIQLATAIRRSISEVLGAPLLSRITAILPFLPFTLKEKKAIGTEAVLSYQELLNQPLSPEDIDTIVARSVRDTNLVEEEGARSLYRIVEAHMINHNELINHV